MTQIHPPPTSPGPTQPFQQLFRDLAPDSSKADGGGSSLEKINGSDHHVFTVACAFSDSPALGVWVSGSFTFHLVPISSLPRGLVFLCNQA